MTSWQEVWSFNTSRFRIVAEVTDCDTDPRDSFEFPEDIEAVQSGRVAWFDARVRVLLDDEEVGADYLGCCACNRPEDLFRHHASYTRELRQLRDQLRRVRDAAKRDRAQGRTSAPALARCAKVRGEVAEILKILRNNASLAPPVIYCEYGPSMVMAAIAEARATLARHASAKLRT